MSATNWAAWVGASTGVGALVWNIYLKLSSGPKLRITAYADMVKRPPPPGDPPFLRITVQNVGTAQTTITGVSFFRYPSKWAKFKHRPMSPAGLMNAFSGPQLPHKLDVGGEWMASMQQDATFEEHLQDRELWCAVRHSFSMRPSEVRVIRTRSA